MLQKQKGIAQITPDEQDTVACADVRNKGRGVGRFDGGTMRMPYPASWLIPDFPTALPRPVGQIEVFGVKRLIKRIKTAKRYKFFPIQGAGSTVSVQRQRTSAPLLFRIRPPESEQATVPVPANQSTTRRLAIHLEYLWVNREDPMVLKMRQQSIRELRVDDKVVVKQKDDGGLAGGDPGITRCAEPTVFLMTDHANSGKGGTDMLRRPIVAAIVHDDQFRMGGKP